MKLLLAALSIASAIIPLHRLAAQAGRGSRDDGAAARTDAILGTPSLTTPVPQTNSFATSPGLEQQAPQPRPSEETASGRSKDKGISADENQRTIRP
jgi:hypothetical protein